MPPYSCICIAGPTGCGKTAVAAQLAAQMNCEIINADSRQVYKDFPIITAQPGEAEKELAPHHLYGFLESRERMDAGVWLGLVQKTVVDIQSRGRLPLFVGGTGFYIEALLLGLAQIPHIDPATRERVAARMEFEGPHALYQELSVLDPLYASRISCNDRQRIQRALEVFAATGKTFSWWHGQERSQPLCQGPLIFIQTSLAELEPALQERISRMLEAGALDEAKAAMAKDARPDSPAWSGIGCKELHDFLSGGVNMEECKKIWLSRTRAYAKRQLTWFRARSYAIPVHGRSLDPYIKILKILKILKSV